MVHTFWIPCLPQTAWNKLCANLLPVAPLWIFHFFWNIFFSSCLQVSSILLLALLLALTSCLYLLYSLPKYTAWKFFIQIEIDKFRQCLPKDLALPLIQHPPNTLDSLNWTLNESFSWHSHLRAFVHVSPSAYNYFFQLVLRHFFLAATTWSPASAWMSLPQGKLSLSP